MVICHRTGTVLASEYIFIKSFDRSSWDYLKEVGSSKVSDSVAAVEKRLYLTFVLEIVKKPASALNVKANVTIKL